MFVAIVPFHRLTQLPKIAIAILFQCFGRVKFQHFSGS